MRDQFSDGNKSNVKKTSRGLSDRSGRWFRWALTIWQLSGPPLATPRSVRSANERVCRFSSTGWLVRRSMRERTGGLDKLDSPVPTVRESGRVHRRMCRGGGIARSGVAAFVVRQFLRLVPCSGGRCAEACTTRVRARGPLRHGVGTSHGTASILQHITDGITPESGQKRPICSCCKTVSAFRSF